MRLVARSYFFAAIVSANPWIFPVSRLDRMGVSGIVVKGEVFETSGLRTLAVDGLVS